VLNLTEKGVEVFIKKYKSDKQESFWDNYDLIIWNKNNSGFTNIKGLFRNNSWGLADKISVSDQGVWKLSKKYVKYFK
jgi:hypothetical protein